MTKASRTPGRKPTPPVDRVLARIHEADCGCWIYTGRLNTSGYAQVHAGSRTDGTRRLVTAHRVVYEAMVGPIPSGWHVDHLCRDRACVNPTHLEAVDHDTNHARRQLTADQHFALRLTLRR